MIKRVLCTILVILILTPSTAYADVVWDNEFDRNNRDKTIDVNRSFYINGDSGYLISVEAPGSRREDRFGGGRYENGNVVRVSRAYNHRGKYWGLIDWGGHGGPDGWVPMDELLVRYMDSDFLEEFYYEFYDYTGDINNLLEYEWFYLWQWPGSDREKYTYDYLDREWVGIEEVNVEHAFLDYASRVWVYVKIMGGWSGGGLSRAGGAAGWVCISDPDNSRDIPAFNPAPDPVPWSPDEEPDWYGTNPPTEIIPPATPERTPATPESTPERTRENEEQAEDNNPDEFTALVVVSVLILAMLIGTVTLVVGLRYRKPKK